MDIRLKSLAYEYGGHTYKLVCNMNVLAEQFNFTLTYNKFVTAQSK